jgi:cytochrome P450
MTDRQIPDEMATFLVAGHETTAVTLAWTFHLLGQHPEIRERLQNEVHRVLGGRLPGPEDLPQLALTSRVIELSQPVAPDHRGRGGSPPWAVIRADRP